MTALRPIKPPKAILDVSNIAHLGQDRPYYRHFLDAKASLKEWPGLKGYEFFCIADAGLPDKVPRYERREVEEALATGNITRVPAGSEADPWILQYANKHDAVVVSNDRFRPFYRHHRWLLEEHRVVRPMWVGGLRWAWEWVDLAHNRVDREHEWMIELASHFQWSSGLRRLSERAWPLPEDTLRIHHLVRDLDRPAKQILADLAKLGYRKKSISSAVSDEEVLKLRAAHGIVATNI